MNDTKWREVLALISELKTEFSVAFVWEEAFQHASLVDPSILGAHLIADPGFGGPCAYKDLFSVRIERFARKRNPATGAEFLDESLSQQLLSRLSSLGALPVEISPKYIYIQAYGNRVTAKPCMS